MQILIIFITSIVGWVIGAVLAHVVIERIKRRRQERIIIELDRILHDIKKDA